MSRIEETIKEVHKLDYEAKRENFLNDIHPLFKLLVTLLYLLLLSSISKYDYKTCIYMSVYLVMIKYVGELSVRRLWKRLKVVFTLVLIIGAVNPFLDRQFAFWLGNIPVSFGMISMFTLILKGCFAITASYFFIITTGIEKMCMALRQLHVPNLLITVILLIYRYIVVFLKETQRIWLAYSMRAPREKGVSFRAWGSMIGSMIIRSIARANTVYQSMELRGFDIDTYYNYRVKIRGKDIGYLVVCVGVIVTIRFLPVFEVIGQILLKLISFSK